MLLLCLLVKKKNEEQTLIYLQKQSAQKVRKKYSKIFTMAITISHALYEIIRIYGNLAIAERKNKLTTTNKMCHFYCWSTITGRVVWYKLFIRLRTRTQTMLSTFHKLSIFFQLSICSSKMHNCCCWDRWEYLGSKAINCVIVIIIC